MTKKRTKAVILDHSPSISISFIRKAIGLNRIGRRSKSLNLYSINPMTGKKEVQASITVTVDIDINRDDFIELQYYANGKPLIQHIPLAIQKSNLTNGHRYYFSFSEKGIRSQKLYFDGRMFVPRQLIEKADYITHIQSRKQRNDAKDLKSMIRLQNIANQAKKPYFKRFYDGDLTKRYMKILEATESLKASW